MLWDRGGLVVNHEAAQLGAPLMHLETRSPESSDGPDTAKPYVPRVSDTDRIITALSQVAFEVAGLRDDLYARSAHGRWRRFRAWILRAWREVSSR